MQGELQKYLDAYSTTSVPLRLPSPGVGFGERAIQRLARFSCTEDQSAGGGAAARAGCVCFTGGPIWRLDWAPPYDSPSAMHLAVCAHPAARQHNVMGRAVAGPALLQIWEVASTAAQGGPQARLALGICLDGGLAWDCKWRPGVGVLALALGSGAVQLLSLPRSMLQLEGSTAAPRLARQLPEACTDAGALGGSLVSTLEWLATPPHDLLLAGCWDGTVALWRVRLEAAGPGGAPGGGSAGEAQERMQLLLHFGALEGPVRALAWAPPPPAGEAQHLATNKAAQRHLFAVAGHSDKLRVWDTRDTSAPLMEAGLQTRWKMGLHWLRAPAGAWVAEDGGIVRWLDLDPFGRTHRTPTNLPLQGSSAGANWSVHCSPGEGHTVYAGEDGVVAAVDVGGRAGSATSPLAGFHWDGQALCVLSGEEAGRGSRRAGAANALPTGKVAIHCVRWSAPQKGASWLAHGGAAGVLRLQLVAKAARR